MREIKLLRATTHEHVVSVIEAFRSQSSGNVYLVRNGCQAVDTWVDGGAKGSTAGGKGRGRNTGLHSRSKIEGGAQGPTAGGKGVSRLQGRGFGSADITPCTSQRHHSLDIQIVSMCVASLRPLHLLRRVELICHTSHQLLLPRTRTRKSHSTAMHLLCVYPR